MQVAAGPGACSHVLQAPQTISVACSVQQEHGGAWMCLRATRDVGNLRSILTLCNRCQGCLPEVARCRKRSQEVTRGHKGSQVAGIMALKALLRAKPPVPELPPLAAHLARKRPFRFESPAVAPPSHMLRLLTVPP